MTDAPEPQPELQPPHPSAWQGTGRPRRPLGLVGALVVFAVWLALSSLGFLPGTFGPIAQAPVPQALATGFLVLCLLAFRWSDLALGLPRPGTQRIMWLPWLYLPGFGALVVWVGTPPVTQLIGLFALMVWIAVSEELMFRGILFPALRRRLRIWPAMLLTSGVFGLIHLGNGLEIGDFRPAAVQSVAAISTGLLLLAMRLRRGSIWPAVVYHLMWNLGAFSLELALRQQGKDGEPALFSLMILPLIVVVPNGLYALWLLRHAGRGDLPGDVPGAP